MQTSHENFTTIVYALFGGTNFRVNYGELENTKIQNTSTTAFDTIAAKDVFHVRDTNHFAIIKCLFGKKKNY